MRSKRPKQLTLELRRHGGARRGAGRPPVGERAGVAHATRSALSGREPVLVTMKLRAGLTSLRTRSAFARVLDGLVAARERLGARIVHFSVQRDHVHLVVEARGTVQLSRAMQGLAVRLARGVNRAMNRTGKVFGDRFHDRVLRTPRQVRHALAYVLCNARKHGVAPPRRGWLDPYSSAGTFDGWTHHMCEAPLLASPRTWLLGIGWRRAGLLDPDHRPGPIEAAVDRRSAGCGVEPRRGERSEPVRRTDLDAIAAEVDRVNLDAQFDPPLDANRALQQGSERFMRASE